ncbi:hypothetical protein [Streptomyces stelliscabiei]|uniref:hypothetical protein n=1 Tax=Streptomyces stelliscabiei TaxID=146820 RepID=UPI000AE6C6B7|nr:hypothetical protein [Streptomyces stelliscabiei]MDX2614716.1 hypothetical protein [Streptomyces stelliscabiei]MDX3626829.1 hypothetical protein [Streptomyces stelliscabiei]SOD76330.1 hypothetical protein SAMN06272781_4160 [Streptomyces sp. 1222.2]
MGVTAGATTGPERAGDNKRGYVVGFKGFAGFMGATGFAGFKKAAVVAGAALTLAVVGGQGPAQAQDRAQARTVAGKPTVTAPATAAVTAPVIVGGSFAAPVVDSIVERVCATPLPIRLPLCGEQGGGASKPVNGWQIETPKPKQ